LHHCLDHYIMRAPSIVSNHTSFFAAPYRVPT